MLSRRYVPKTCPTIKLSGSGSVKSSKKFIDMNKTRYSIRTLTSLKTKRSIKDQSVHTFSKIEKVPKKIESLDYHPGSMKLFEGFLDHRNLSHDIFNHQKSIKA